MEDEDEEEGEEDEEDPTPEQLWALMYPAQAVMAYINKGKAEEAVKNMDGKHNGKGDAFRHAYWTYLNTNDFGGALAISLGVAHEASVPGPIEETNMDLNNNAWGASFATNNPSADFEDFVDAFNAALANGDVIVLDDDRSPVSPY